MDTGEGGVIVEIQVSNTGWDRERDRAEFIGTGIGYFVNQLVLKEHRRYLVGLLRWRLAVISGEEIKQKVG